MNILKYAVKEKIPIVIATTGFTNEEELIIPLLKRTKNKVLKSCFLFFNGLKVIQAYN